MTDPILAEVHRARQALLQESGGDVAVLFERLRAVDAGLAGGDLPRGPDSDVVARIREHLAQGPAEAERQLQALMEQIAEAEEPGLVEGTVREESPDYGDEGHS